MPIDDLLNLDDPFSIEKELFIINILKVLVAHNIIPEKSLRNALIKFDIKQLRREGISAEKAKQILADKYFLGIKAIESKIYTHNQK